MHPQEDILGDIHSSFWPLQIGNVLRYGKQISGNQDYIDCQGWMLSRLLGTRPAGTPGENSQHSFSHKATSNSTNGR
jgi:hypothetical protein